MQKTSRAHVEEETLAVQIGILLMIVGGLMLVGIVFGRVGLFNRFANQSEIASEGMAVYTAKDLRFGEDVLTVSAGETILLRLENDDFLPHSFDVDALGLHLEMPSNETLTFTLEGLEPGTYEIYCAVPGHREAGMVATLVVQD